MRFLQRLHAFVNIYVESPLIAEVAEALSGLYNVEELFEVTGEFDLVALVSAKDIEEFRGLVKDKIMKIRGVKSTVTTVVLETFKGLSCKD